MNTYDQLIEAVRLGIIPKEKAVAVSYTPSSRGRMGYAQCDKSSVYSPFFNTEPKSAWCDNGMKSFVGNRKESLPEALAWATAKYGITDWKGNAMGDKVPAVVHKGVPMKREP